MSGPALTWAWEQECPSRTAKLILVCLANKANGEPRCWPSFATIAVECGIARRHVPYYIRQLADAGLIAVERRHLNGGALSNGYVLALGTASDAVGTDVPILGTGGVPTDGGGVSQQRHPNLKKEPIGRKEEPPIAPRKRGDRLEGFEAWYREYPHKVGRGQAERAWPLALRLASADQLAAGLRRYIRTKPPDHPWKNPATWLNGKCWLDEPAEVVPQANGKPSGDLPGNTSLGTADESMWRLRLAHYAKSKFWNQNWGFPPDDPDCYAPVALLSEYGFLRSEQHA